MRRHAEAGEAPEATGPSNSYGSAFHEVMSFLARSGGSDEEAVQAAIASPYGRWLAPEDIERLRRDLVTYREREYHGVSLVLAEEDLRVPLMSHKGEQYYYRFKVDRLYRSARFPGTFIHIDYKTSKWPKTAEEVHKDIQMSAYAFGLREMFPEIETLVQVYDQLSYSAIPTTRTPRQIELIREWLVTNAIVILEDDELLPTYNTFCAYCSVIMDCPIIPQLTDYALGEISGLMPKQEGGSLIGQNGEVLEGAALEPYVEMLDKVAQAKRILEAFDGRVRGTLRELPVDRRLALGWKTTTPKVSSWPPEALEAVAEVLGPQFWSMVSLTQTAVDRLPEEQRAVVKGMAVKHLGSPRMTRMKPPAESAFGEGDDAAG